MTIRDLLNFHINYLIYMRVVDCLVDKYKSTKPKSNSRRYKYVTGWEKADMWVVAKLLDNRRENGIRCG